jgi:glycosyltransferase involved in cell wall biosynthesis
MLANVYNQASDYDVIHSHLETLTAPFAVTHATPTLITIHTALDMPSFIDELSAFPQLRYISISESQREPLPDLNWAATVYHGLAIHDYPVNYEPGAYLLFSGRISPETGPDRAIAIARRCGIPLKIAAKIDTKDRTFYERDVKPLLDDPLIEFVGPVSERKKRALMRGALALLAPIRWSEPFGLVYIESLACGTPVLTCPYGSASELLRDRVTGFLRESDDELAKAARHVDEISRAGCRAWAEQRFDVSLMTQRYLAAYQGALAGRQPRHMVAIPVEPHRDDIGVPPNILTEEQPSPY